MTARRLLLVLGVLAGAAQAAAADAPTLASLTPDEEADLWRAARAAVSAEPVWRYLDRFPKGHHSEGARRRLAMLGLAPGRRFDGRWSGELRCSQGFTWLRLPLAAEIEDGQVRAGRDGAGAARFEAAGRIGPDGTLELTGIAGRLAGPLGNSEAHQVYLDVLLAAGAADARGVLGPMLCVAELARGD